MNTWRELWLTNCMFGSRTGCEIHDASWALALNVEHASLNGNFIGGVSMDRKKFFDFLQYDVGLFLLKTLGAPQGVLHAAGNLYMNLRCCYKLRKASSAFFAKRHGFAQGDSFSLQVALAYMTVWTKYMKADPMLDLPLNTGSFLDDSHFYNISCDLNAVVDALVTSWKRSLSFDALIGLETNSKKSFFFTNHLELQARILEAMKEFPENSRFRALNSFKLLGSVVTSLGAPDTSIRNQRVFSTVEKLVKLRYAPLRFSYRVKMASAIFKAALFGCELVELTKGLTESLRSSIVSLLWKGKTWCRCWATTATHIVPTHMLHPQAASIYYVLTMLSRLLRRRADLRQLVQDLHDNFDQSLSIGPMTVLSQCINNLQGVHTSPFVIHTYEGVEVNLLDPQQEKFRHLLREALRSWVLRTNVAFGARKDMQGGPRLAYELNTALMQQRKSCIKRGLSLVEQAALRNIFTGAVHTQSKKYKANCVSSAQCPWCAKTDETVFHLFWECTAWSDCREHVQTQYSDVLQYDLPPILVECGLLPTFLIENGTISHQIAPRFIQDVQLMMIAILSKRNVAIKNRQNPDDSDTTKPTKVSQPTVVLEGSSRTKEDFYPNFPWMHDTLDIFDQKAFVVDAPANWRVYRSGSEWLFGVDLFEPLHWYWSQLRWPQHDVYSPGITWLELALDFHAATHCPLSMPGDPADSATACQRARFFNSASRRMAAICEGKLAPCSFATHCPVLTTLDMGRCSGFTSRPRLLCPEFVHSCLYLSALELAGRVDKNFRFVPVLPTYSKSLWFPSKPKVRLVGKQTPATAVPAPSQRRNVKSHKETVASVTWTCREISIISTATDWRHKQQIEKVLFHNRTATTDGKHVIGAARIDKSFRCEICSRKNVNLSKLMLDQCSGVNESGTKYHTPRDGVKLRNRQALVRDHNARATFHHVLKDPLQSSDPVTCIHCGAKDPEGWRRFHRFAKQTCPFAS